MEFINALPIWLLAVLIFLLRIVDVSLGTIRTIVVVNGRINLSVLLGFFEVLVWVSVVSQVISRINQQPVLILAYAGGYATGNAAGIVLERLLAIGSCVVRLISVNMGKEISEALRDQGQAVTVFHGTGRDGTRMLLYATCHRRDLHQLLETAKRIDPNVFYVVERVAESSRLVPLHHHSVWHGWFKRH